MVKDPFWLMDFMPNSPFWQEKPLSNGGPTGDFLTT